MSRNDHRGRRRPRAPLRLLDLQMLDDVVAAVLDWSGGGVTRKSRRGSGPTTTRPSGTARRTGLARRVSEEQHRLVHVPHVARREHRLILLDQGHDVRSGMSRVVHHDELGPSRRPAEPDRGDAAARRGLRTVHAPHRSLSERQIFHVPLAAGSLASASRRFMVEFCRLAALPPGRNVADL